MDLSRVGLLYMHSGFVYLASLPKVHEMSLILNGEKVAFPFPRLVPAKMKSLLPPDTVLSLFTKMLEFVN